MCIGASSFFPKVSVKCLSNKIQVIRGKLGSDGVVVITSALHAEGREFDPRSDLYFRKCVAITITYE